jgi:APA family basic amino acid/polyamine antiporter
LRQAGPQIVSADDKPAALQRSIAPTQFVIFGFGSIVGTAWVVLLGGWLNRAGPGGMLLGITLGGMAMALIAMMYAELASRFPQTGGEITYITKVFGKQFGFIVGWLLTLAYLSNLVFEGVALGWLFGILCPTLKGPTLYSVFGQSIGAGSLGLAMVSCLTIATLNYRGARSFVRFQNGLTITFLAIVLTSAALELASGSPSNMQPFWQSRGGGSWLTGAVWVFGSVPMIFNGFQTVLHAIEERSESTPAETVVRLCAVPVGIAIVFYLFALSSAMMAVPWMTLASSELPAVGAVVALPWASAFRTAFLLALIASLLKAWNAVFMTSVRMLFAQSREGMIPSFFSEVNPMTGSPGKTVIVVAIFNLAGILLGKGLLDPLVNAMSVCIATIYALICTATLVTRARYPDHVGFRAPGGYPLGILSIVAAAGMVVFALLQPAVTSEVDAFKWVLLLVWAALGLFFYLTRNRKAPGSRRQNGAAS